MKGGIINSVTRLHLVGCFCWIILRCTDPLILNLYYQAWILCFCLYWSIVIYLCAFLMYLSSKIKFPLNKLFLFLIIKPTRCTNFSNLFLEWNSTCFGQFLCPSSGVFHCTHSNGICRTGLLTACERDQDGTSWSCLQAVSKPVRHIPLLCDRGTAQNMWSFILRINLRN